MAVGYIAAFSETLALAVIVSKGVVPLKDVSSINVCMYVVQSLCRRESLREPSGGGFSRDFNA